MIVPRSLSRVLNESLRVLPETLWSLEEPALPGLPGGENAEDGIDVVGLEADLVEQQASPAALI
jgi:hypothetical protein